MRRSILLLLLLLLLLALVPVGACAPGAAETSASAPSAEAACAARGGTLTRVGRLQSLQCVVAYADAGERCTSGEDCQGDCRIEEGLDVPAEQPAAGVCQADSSRFGCYAVVEAGRARPPICVD